MRAIIVVLCLCCCLKIEGSPIKESSFTCFINSCEFKNEQLIHVFSTDSAAFKIAENYTGIAQIYFYAISPSNKSQTASIYNEDIAFQIHLINKNIKSLSECSTASANLVSKTLIKLTTAVNQLIIDSSLNASKSVLKKDYVKIQNIVDSFKKKFPHTLGSSNKKSVGKAINWANESLQAFANNTEIYTRQLNALVFKSSLGNQALISSQNKLVLNLRKFVIASTIAVYLSTS